jgi:hypothetical protein
MENEKKPSKSKIMSLRSGIDYRLEEEAEKWLAKGRAEGDRGDYLSQDQLDLRQKREISNQLGVADASLVAGIYRRAHNPQMGHRPGKQGRSHDDG